jgi:hypothetical protein
MRALAQLGQARRRNAQNVRSAGRSRGWQWRRLHTASCWRRARFSTMNSSRDQSNTRAKTTVRVRARRAMLGAWSGAVHGQVERHPACARRPTKSATTESCRGTGTIGPGTLACDLLSARWRGRSLPGGVEVLADAAIELRVLQHSSCLSVTAGSSRAGHFAGTRISLHL